MPTAPTPITPLPTAPSRADPANFPARADAFMSALPTFGSQLNANASAAFTNASDSVTAATNAAASQTSAAASATAAAASAVTAVNAPGTSGTSTTSLTIGTGSQTLTTQTGKAWVVGQFVTVASTASPTNFMHGQITAYNSGTGSMTVNVLAVGGSGTLASWTIGLVGPNATLTDQNSLQPVALTLPNIRPSLLLDFANSKKLDPRITFTRATSGTYYDGVTSAKAEENLLLRSQDFSTTWTLTNLTAGSAVTAPDATATGSSFTASAANGTLTQSVTAIAGDHTFSVWLRRVSGTGNIDITAHSGGTWVTQTITSSWARYTVTQTLTAGTRTPGIRIVTSGDQIEVWGAQLEQRSAATAYTPTTTQPITNYIPQLLTAPAGVPRFDHNPTTGESLGLLVEEQRTNLWTYSEEFDNAAWYKAPGVTVTPNTDIAPDGTLTADTFTSSAGNQIEVGVACSTNTVYTNSICFKKTSGATYQPGLYLLFSGGTLVIYAVRLNTDTGVATAVSASGFTAPLSFSVLDLGNYWRVSVSGNSNNNTTAVLRAYPNFTAGAGSSAGSQVIWGAQLEAGAFPTSYIPTTSASVTRTADAASMTGVNFSSWYRQDEGAVYAELTTPVPASITNGYCWYATDGTTANRIEVQQTGSGNPSPRLSALIRYLDNTVATWLVTTITKGWVSNNTNAAKLSLAYKTSDAYLVSDRGDVPVSSTPSNIPRINRVDFGGNYHYKKLAYYPKRLTNAQLQALTA